LIRSTRRTLLEECGIHRGERILVGLSGGGDSSALVHVLSGLSEELGISVVAHGVDHGLRPEASRELDGAEALCRSLGVPFGRTRLALAPGGNVQARARDGRLAALKEAADAAGAGRIATAHHADDRAETVLIRLLHGAGPEGLWVLPPVQSAPGERATFIRPMVRARKRDVRLHLERHRIPFVEDPSNLDRRFLRVRVRLELLPLLEELSPAIVAHLTGLSDELGNDPVPEVVDGQGLPVRLRRAHVQSIRRALRLGHWESILISGGRELTVDPKARAVTVRERHARTESPSRPSSESVEARARPEVRERARPARGTQKGDAKTGKSG
jgi:tRNA(Ile)-lysidine synthase